MSSDSNLRLVTSLEGESIFLKTKINLTFYFNGGMFIVHSMNDKDENKNFQIIFKNEGEFNKAMRSCLDILFIKKETAHDEIWEKKTKISNELILYTSDEFMDVMGRLMDDITFSCEICVSVTGGYKDFFHCVRCLHEGGSFVVCLSCIDENPDGYKEHQDEFYGHFLQNPEDENISILYIELIKANE